jgi:hypothetical protein
VKQHNKIVKERENKSESDGTKEKKRKEKDFYKFLN